MVLSVGGVASRVEKQFMSAAAEGLGNDVFHQHAFVDVHFVEEDGAVELVIQIIIVHERVGYQKTGVCHIAFL